MIPPLDFRGLLPQGIHTGNWTEVQSSFATDSRRTQLIENVKAFSHSDLKILNPSPLYLAGSTFSDKPRPSDIEATIKVDPSSLVPEQVAAVFRLQAAHNMIKHTIEVDFYVTLDLPGANDFSQFFQYVGEKTAATKSLQAKDKRGVIEVTKWHLP